MEKNVLRFSQCLLSIPIPTQCKSIKKWPTGGTPNNWCNIRIHDCAIFWIFWCFVAFFEVFDGVISRYLWQWRHNYSYWKPPSLFDNWWKCEVNWLSDVLSGSPYICEGSKYPLLENGSRVILTTMGQYTFFNFIPFLSTALFCFAFWEKKVFYFFFFLIFFSFSISFFSVFSRLAEMGHHSSCILLTSDITTFFISISQIRVLMFRLFAAMFQNSLYLFCQYTYVTILLQVFWNIEWLYRMTETSSETVLLFLLRICVLNAGSEDWVRTVLRCSE